MTTRVRWGSLWQALQVPVPERAFEELVSRYSEPHRRYHTLVHIAECLAHFDDARQLCDRCHEVELAIWFHDAVYDTRAPDNETRSARYAADLLASAGLPIAVQTRLRDLVLATRHDVMPSNRDTKVLVDVDLAILGAPRERFDEYEKQIREEYAWVPEDVFRSARRAVVEAFLARPAIFHTEHFESRLERTARDNLARSLQALGAV